MIKVYVCDIVGTGQSDDDVRDPFRAVVYGVARSFVTDIPSDPVTGHPLFKRCVVKVAGDSSVHESMSQLAGVQELEALAHDDLHAQLAEGRSKTFAVRSFPETANLSVRVDQALQQQHRSGEEKNLRIFE